MNILTISTRFYPSVGGVETTSWETVRGLAEYGHNVVAMASNVNTVNPRSILERLDKVCGIDIYRFRNIVPSFIDRNGALGFVTPGLTLRLPEILRKYSINIIHSHGYGFYPSYGVLPMILSKRIPWVVTASTSPETPLPRFLYDRIIGRLILRRADRIIVQTELERKFLLEMGAEQDKVVILPGGVYSEIPHVSTPSQRISDIVSGDPFILYVGRLAPNKGIDLLIRAYHSIAKKIFGIKLVLAGQDAGIKDEIIRLLHDLDLEERVFLTGFVDQNDLHWLYRSTIFFCSPSTYGEAQNMTAAQALAYGKPVIVSDTGGMGDFYHDIEGAIVVRKRHLEDLISAMAYLIDNHKEIRIKQKKKVLYTWEEVATATEHLYEELL